MQPETKSTQSVDRDTLFDLAKNAGLKDGQKYREQREQIEQNILDLSLPVLNVIDFAHGNKQGFEAFKCPQTAVVSKHEKSISTIAFVRGESSIIFVKNANQDHAQFHPSKFHGTEQEFAEMTEEVIATVQKTAPENLFKNTL